jgi:hypothetical protein
MKALLIIALFLTLASCRTAGHHGDMVRDYGTEPSVMGPSYDNHAPKGGSSVEVGGTIFIDCYTIHRDK